MSNNRNTRKRCEICSNLTTKTPEQRQWRGSDVFIADFEQENVSWGLKYLEVNNLLLRRLSWVNE